MHRHSAPCLYTEKAISIILLKTMLLGKSIKGCLKLAVHSSNVKWLTLKPPHYIWYAHTEQGVSFV